VPHITSSGAARCGSARWSWRSLAVLAAVHSYPQRTLHSTKVSTTRRVNNYIQISHHVQHTAESVCSITFTILAAYSTCQLSRLQPFARHTYRCSRHARVPKEAVIHDLCCFGIATSDSQGVIP
jgi:hypothetical protein